MTKKFDEMTFDELLNSLMKLRDRHAVREEQQATDGCGTYWYKNEATQNIINELKKRRTIDRPDHLSNLDYEELLQQQQKLTDLLKDKKEEKTQQLCDNIHELINKINTTEEEVTVRFKVKTQFNDLTSTNFSNLNYEIEVINADDLPERLVTILTNNKQLGFQALDEDTEKSLKEAQDTINKKFRVLTELEGSKASERLFKRGLTSPWHAGRGDDLIHKSKESERVTAREGSNIEKLKNIPIEALLCYLMQHINRRDPRFIPRVRSITDKKYISLFSIEDFSLLHTYFNSAHIYREQCDLNYFPFDDSQYPAGFWNRCIKRFDDLENGLHAEILDYIGSQVRSSGCYHKYRNLYERLVAFEKDCKETVLTKKNEVKIEFLGNAL